MDDSPSDPGIRPSNGTRRADSDQHATLSRIFGIDLRSLAVLRVSLGLIILLDLISRARYMTAHYTDRGVMPRNMLYAYLLQPTQWSFHLLSGSAAWQILLFVLSGLIAVAMIFGFRTRWAVFFAWAFAASLQYRNPMVNNSGDQLLRLLLFWSIFLPLGAKFSVDAAVNSGTVRQPPRILNMASFALLMQVCIVYWFTAALKSHPIWIADHTAVYYALSIEQFVTPLGKIIYDYPGLMKALTVFTLYLEIIGPCLAFMPVATAPFRLVVIVLFLLLHAGFGLSIRLGFFPWISAASWMIFLPSEFWDRLFARLRTPSRLGLTIYFDGDCGFCKRLALAFRTFLLLPETALLPAQTNASIHEAMIKHHSWVVVDATGQRYFKFDAFLATIRESPLLFWLVPFLSLAPISAAGRKFYEFVAANRHRTGVIVRALAPRPLAIDLPKPVNLAVGALFAYVVLWNVRTLDYEKYQGFLPPSTDPIGYVTSLAQRWDMFAPFPWSDDGWYIVTAQLHDGRIVDILRGGQDVSWEKPDWIVDDYPSQRWRKYLMNLSRDTYGSLRRPYAQYLCWDWNRRHEYDEQLDGLDIYFMREITQPNYEVPPPEKRLLYAHHNIPAADPSSEEPGAIGETPSPS